MQHAVSSVYYTSMVECSHILALEVFVGPGMCVDGYIDLIHMFLLCRGNWHGDVAIKVLNMDPYLDNKAQLSAFKLEVHILLRLNILFLLLGFYQFN